MGMQQNKSAIPFLAGGGEMGALMREKDWSLTPVGDPSTWPQSLRTTINILLKSKFPMFLWWGEDLICFYNDAYRPSLGVNGKHPSILGEPARTAWAEIWPVISPFITQVLNGGEAVWREDQLIPIFRNGQMEDVYWTFSYSPVTDDTDRIAGVLVICNETTGKMEALQQIRRREEQLNFTLDAAELATWDLNPANNRFTGNARLKEWFGIDAKDEIDLEAAINSIHPGDKQRVTDAIRAAMQPGSDGNYQVEYTVINPLTGQERHLLAKGKAIFSEGVAVRFSGTLQDLTPQITSRRKAEEIEKRFRNTVKQAPLGITIFRGRNFVTEMANETYLQFVDKTEEEFVGKPLFETLPEVKEVVEPLLNGVMDTGVAFTAQELPVTIKRYGKEEITYFNFVYQPLKENGEITGIMVVCMEVTDSVRSKHALAESEKQFRSLVMQSPIPMTIFRGPQHVVEMANSIMYENIWRKKPEEVLGKPIVEVFPELKEQKYEALLQRVYEKGEPYTEKESIAYVQGNDGMKKFYLDFEYAPLFDVENRVTGIIVTVNDVTERKEALIKAEENERRLNIVIDASDLGTWEWNLVTNELISSQRHLEIFNYSGDPEKGDHAKHLALVHPDDRKIREQAYKVAMETGVYDYQARIVWHDGSLHWIEARGRVFYDEENKPVRMLGTTRDITEEKNSQELMKNFASDLERKVQQRTNELMELNESLAQSEQRYHLMVEEVEDYAILYLSRDGIVENWNKGAEKIKGYTSEEIIGKSFSVFYPEYERSNKLPEKLLQQAVEKGRAHHEGFRMRKDGSLFWANVTITAVHDEFGNVIGFSKMTHDLTEKKKADDKLRQNAEQLAEKNKALEKMNSELQSFAYVSSHDLQEPLRKIQTFASRILSKEAHTLTENGLDYFKRMQDAAGRMQVLIQDLLAYSRTSTTDKPFEKTNLNHIAEEVQLDIKETQTDKQAVIEIGDLGEANVIPFQFRQLLYNLIGNAIKFARPGVAPHVTVEGEVVKGGTVTGEKLSAQKLYTHISVTDNGIGFDPQYRTRIFEVFQRLHGKDEYSGTGIGLAIVKKIVDNHNGAISASGEINKGARFDIYLPL